MSPTYAPRGRRTTTCEELCWAAASAWVCDQVMASAASRPHVADAPHLTIDLPHDLAAVPRADSTGTLVGEVAVLRGCIRRLEVAGARPEYSMPLPQRRVPLWRRALRRNARSTLFTYDAR